MLLRESIYSLLARRPKQIFHINFWLNINHINYASKKVYLFQMQIKMSKNYQITKSRSLKFLYCCPDFWTSGDVWPENIQLSVV